MGKRKAAATASSSTEKASPPKKRGGRGGRPTPSVVDSSAVPVKPEVKVEGYDRKGYELPLPKVNPHITCSICGGYFIDATTVIECLHTFCKSCLLAHFEDVNNNCPKCDQLVHQSHPSHYVAFDRTMQDIVYKLVPGLLNEEQTERKQFRAQRRKEKGLEEEPAKNSKDEDKATNRCYPSLQPKFSHHRNDEQVVIRLIPERGLKTISRPIVRTSDQTTINTLKRYLAFMFWNDQSKYHALDMFCNGELMGRDYSMRFIQLTRWRHHKPGTPLALTYRRHIEY